MKSLFLTCSFLITINIYGQNVEGVYRVEQQMESPAISTYNVSLLILEKNGTYELMQQEYSSKKAMRKNLILFLEKFTGIWKVEDTILILEDAQSNRTLKFSIKNSRKISLFIEDLEVSDLYWKKIM